MLHWVTRGSRRWPNICDVTFAKCGVTLGRVGGLINVTSCDKDELGEKKL